MRCFLSPFAKEIDFAGLSSMLETFSFQYPHYHVFMASAPDGTFTKEQEAEVIDILKSFTTTSSYISCFLYNILMR